MKDRQGRDTKDSAYFTSANRGKKSITVNVAKPEGQALIRLAGLPQDYTLNQLMAFRNGQRPATIMHQIAKGYSDQQIDALAGWFAAQKR